MRHSAQVLTGPAAPTEPNTSKFNRGCPICGWESEETVEASSTKFAKCPKCGADFDQPFMINTQPAELELLTPRVGKEKNMKKDAQAVQTNVNKDSIKQSLIDQGIAPDVADQASALIEQKTKAQPNQNQPQTPQQPSNGVKSISNLLGLILKKSWGDGPGRINFEPGYEPPRLAEADEKEEIDMFHADEEESEGEELTPEAAHELGEKIGINWDEVEFTEEDFLAGYKIELEHGSKNDETNVTNDDPEMTAKIAWAHLKEDPEYYKKLQKLEGDKHEVQAAMRRQAITVRELQEVMLPQLEENFFQIDVALQNSDLGNAREMLHDAASRFATVKDKIDSLGDVDPTIISPKEDGGFLSKLGL
jgi:hypothetical protein